MKKLILSAAFAFASLAANATVITFDGHTNTQFGDEDVANGLEVATTQGYNFSSSGDHFHFAIVSPSNGTSSLVEDRSYNITMAKADGGKFDLLSLLGYSYGSTSLSITGYSATGSLNTTVAVNSSAFTNITLTGFTNLNRVVFSGNSGLENISVQDASQVPEPVSLSLMGLGLAGFALSRRKSKAKMC